MTYKEQLDLWVAGQSVHRDETNECCPDFSCCNKDVSTPQEIKELFRTAYLQGNDILVEKMLMRFLSNAIQTLHPHKEVRIAGDYL